MNVFREAGEMRRWSREQRGAGRSIGFVPTMGALHEGHASLIRASVDDNDLTVASIFVNPAQFAPEEDFDEYPRTWDADYARCEELGVNVLYAPAASGMYPAGYATYVEVERLSEPLCGVTRPHFFRGVATVVAKLFLAVEPDRAYFGQKDGQQAAVIRRMVRDLDFGLEVIEQPIVREPDGLAMSSRNQYLTAPERLRALALWRGLSKGREMLAAGERDAAAILDAVYQTLEPEVDRVDYVELVDAEEMTPVARVDRPVMLAVAAYVGETRLIDNIKYTPEKA
jgi:pantoate--beta-alanine ligase